MIYAIVLMGNNIRVASHEFLFIDLFVTIHMHYYLLESENAAKCAVEFSLNFFFVSCAKSKCIKIQCKYFSCANVQKTKSISFEIIIISTFIPPKSIIAVSVLQINSYIASVLFIQFRKRRK